MKKRVLCICMSMLLSVSSAISVSAGENNKSVFSVENTQPNEVESEEIKKSTDNVDKTQEQEKIAEPQEEQNEDKDAAEDAEQGLNDQEAQQEVSKDEAEIIQNDAATVLEQTKNSGINLAAVANLKAVPAGKTRVQLSWDKSSGAEEYIIYRQIGKGSFSYRYITKNLTYPDTTASGLDYNFYRVYPCYNNAEGKRVVGPSTNYVYAKATLTAVNNLKAVSAGKKQVKLTWNKVNGAEGYIIYRQIGKSTFSYRYLTANLSYTDTTASDEEYNYYRVYPYYKQEGKNVTGASQTYVFAKGILPAVTGLKAQVIGKSIKITWNKVNGAEGYIIYRQEGNGVFKYLYMKDATATSYVDTKCSGEDYNYYRVYPYHKSAGKMIAGLSDKYVYSALILEPVEELTSRSSGYKEITIRWTKPRGAEGYFVIRSVGDADNAEIIGQIENGNITKFVDNNASELQDNYYAVVPYLVDGKGQTIITGILVTTSEKAINTDLNTTDYKVSGYESYTNAYSILDKVNAERKKAGRKPLTMDKDLMEAAMQRAAELVINMDHTRPSGLDCFTVEPKAWGENIAMGTYPLYDASTVMSWWMNSEGHRQNILRENFVSIGVGCFEYNGVAYWVQLFGTDMVVKATKPADKYTTRIVTVANDLLRSANDNSDKNDGFEIKEPKVNANNSVNMEEGKKKFEGISVLDNYIKRNSRVKSED